MNATMYQLLPYNQMPSMCNELTNDTQSSINKHFIMSIYAVCFKLSIAIENMSKDTGNTPHIRLQHFSQNKIANYSLINLNTSRQVKLSDNTSKHYLSRVTLACFAKTRADKGWAVKRALRSAFNV